MLQHPTIPFALRARLVLPREAERFWVAHIRNRKPVCGAVIGLELPLVAEFIPREVALTIRSVSASACVLPIPLSL